MARITGINTQVPIRDAKPAAQAQNESEVRQEAERNIPQNMQVRQPIERPPAGAARVPEGGAVRGLEQGQEPPNAQGRVGTTPGNRREAPPAPQGVPAEVPEQRENRAEVAAQQQNITAENRREERAVENRPEINPAQRIEQDRQRPERAEQNPERMNPNQRAAAQRANIPPAQQVTGNRIDTIV